MLIASEPGDLILDPTCGAGTTAYVAEQWGRRWITIDTSRVALALARARVMGARYPYYILADSREGQLKEAEITGTAPSSRPVFSDVRHGFVYERVPHVLDAIQMRISVARRGSCRGHARHCGAAENRGGAAQQFARRAVLGGHG